MAADEAGGFSGEESARDMGERIRKVRADIAETINLHQSNEQNLKIMRKKVRHPCVRWFGAAVVSARCTPASMFAVVVRVCLSGWGGGAPHGVKKRRGTHDTFGVALIGLDTYAL